MDASLPKKTSGASHYVVFLDPIAGPMPYGPTWSLQVTADRGYTRSAKVARDSRNLRTTKRGLPRLLLTRGLRPL